MEFEQLTPEELLAICRLLIGGLSEKEARLIIANAQIADKANQAVRCSVSSSVQEQSNSEEEKKETDPANNHEFNTRFW